MTDHTTDFTFNLNADYVWKCALTASTEQTRYYLNGICIDPAPCGLGAFLVATDGHRMSIFRDREAMRPAYGPAIILFDKTFLAHCKKVTRKRADRVPLYVTETDSGWMAHCEGFTMPAKILDGTFPDWRRVIPADAKSPMGNVGMLDGKYLETFCTMGPMGSRTARVQILPTADDRDPMCVRTDNPNYMGVIMPIARKTSKTDFTHTERQPEWLHHGTTPSANAA